MMDDYSSGPISKRTRSAVQKSGGGTCSTVVPSNSTGVKVSSRKYGNQKGRKLSFATDCGGNKDGEELGGSGGAAAANSDHGNVVGDIIEMGNELRLRKCDDAGDEEDPVDEEEKGKNGLKRQRSDCERPREEPLKIQGVEEEEEEDANVETDSSTTSSGSYSEPSSPCSSDDDSDHGDPKDEDFDLDKAEEEEGDGDLEEEKKEERVRSKGQNKIKIDKGEGEFPKHLPQMEVNEEEKEKVRGAVKQNKMQRDKSVVQFSKQLPRTETNSAWPYFLPAQMTNPGNGDKGVSQLPLLLPRMEINGAWPSFPLAQMTNHGNGDKGASKFPNQLPRMEINSAWPYFPPAQMTNHGNGDKGVSQFPLLLPRMEINSAWPYFLPAQMTNHGNGDKGVSQLPKLLPRMEINGAWPSFPPAQLTNQGNGDKGVSQFPLLLPRMEINSAWPYFPPAQMTNPWIGDKGVSQFPLLLPRMEMNSAWPSFPPAHMTNPGNANNYPRPLDLGMFPPWEVTVTLDDGEMRHIIPYSEGTHVVGLPLGADVPQVIAKNYKDLLCMVNGMTSIISSLTRKLDQQQKDAARNLDDANRYRLELQELKRTVDSGMAVPQGVMAPISPSKKRKFSTEESVPCEAMPVCITEPHENLPPPRSDDMPHTPVLLVQESVTDEKVDDLSITSVKHSGAKDVPGAPLDCSAVQSEKVETVAGTIVTSSSDCLTPDSSLLRISSSVDAIPSVARSTCAFARERVQGYELVGKFKIPEEYESLYEKIYNKYGHMATKKVIKSNDSVLLTCVKTLLEILSGMETVTGAELSEKLLKEWEGLVNDAEALEFNIKWLREGLNRLKNHWTSLLGIDGEVESHKQALDAMQVDYVSLCTRIDELEAELSEAKMKKGITEAMIASEKETIQEKQTKKDKFQCEYVIGIVLTESGSCKAISTV